MHSSQNEQDSRFYGDFSLIPMYEPSNQQEAYDMVYNGFAFSEKSVNQYYCVWSPVSPTLVQV